MKVGFFTSAEAYAEHNRRQAEAIRNNGLRIMKESLDKALDGEDAKERWLSENMMYAEGIDDSYREAEWEHHIEWMCGYIKSLERKIRKLERDADKALANA